jgi:hypothetical protein
VFLCLLYNYANVSCYVKIPNSVAQFKILLDLSPIHLKKMSKNVVVNNIDGVGVAQSVT